MKTPLKNSLGLLTSAALFFAACASLSGEKRTGAPDPTAVRAVTKKVADWQIASFDEHGQHRALPDKSIRARWQNRENYPDLDWHMGALYAGMDAFRQIADAPAKYADWLQMIGSRNQWELYDRRSPYHADAHAVGITWLSLYEDFQDPAMLAPTKERFDWILENPKTGSLEWKRGTDRTDRWGWCDALFMAPPVWAKLAKITGERKYLEFMDQEYRTTYDLLWSDVHGLFFRDTRFFERFEANGEPVFWSRGNGWVIGGLALMIPDLPEDWAGRSFYVNIFEEMAGALKDLQRSDGTWSMGLLGDEATYSAKETSGTAFVTYGMAWGVNNGLLDPAVYQPVIYKAWAALTDAVTDEGLLGYVQPVGAAPGEAFPDKTEVYGIGAFLLAGSEVFNLVQNAPDAPAR